jgi:hypothetical protein
MLLDIGGQISVYSKIASSNSVHTKNELLNHREQSGHSYRHAASIYLCSACDLKSNRRHSLLRQPRLSQIRATTLQHRRHGRRMLLKRWPSGIASELKERVVGPVDDVLDRLVDVANVLCDRSLRARWIG